jgi:hypothetical protein
MRKLILYALPQFANQNNLNYPSYPNFPAPPPPPALPDRTFQQIILHMLCNLFSGENLKKIIFFFLDKIITGVIVYYTGFYLFGLYLLSG